MGDYLATDLVYFMATPQGIGAVKNMTSLLTCGALDGMVDKATKIAGQIKSVEGAVNDVTDTVNGARNGSVP